jgi:hypothetical protein
MLERTWYLHLSYDPIFVSVRLKMQTMLPTRWSCIVVSVQRQIFNNSEHCIAGIAVLGCRAHPTMHTTHHIAAACLTSSYCM